LRGQRFKFEFGHGVLSAVMETEPE
jgi:hypothetical protein